MKTKITVLCTLLFLTGVQFSFGQSHLARKALAVAPDDKNDKSTNDNQPYYGYFLFVYEEGHTYYYSQVITIPSKRENGIRMEDWNAGKPFDDAFKKTLNNTGIPTNSVQPIYFQTSYGAGIDYASEEEAEQGRQKEIKSIQEDKNDSFNGYSVSEITIAVPNKTKGKKQMAYGGSAYVKVENPKTGNEYYLVAAIKYISRSIKDAKSELQSTLELSDYDWTSLKKETPTHYTIDSTEMAKVGHLVGTSFVYTGTASAKVKNFETGEIRTVHSNNAGTTNDKATIREDLTQHIVSQLKDDTKGIHRAEYLITPITYMIKKENR